LGTLRHETVDGDMVAELPKCGEGDILLYRLIFFFLRGTLLRRFFLAKIGIFLENSVTNWK
jgi:hypothetical protein